jgi:hypothetical protein
MLHYDIYAGIVDFDGSVRDTLGFAVSVSDSGRFKSMTDVVFDGTNYLLVWGDDRNHAPSYSDAYGATVSPSGTVLGTFPVVKTPERLWYPALAHSNQGAMLAYNALTGVVGGRNYDGRRVWGKMGPLPGVDGTPNAEVRKPNRGPTIVRGVLRLEEGSSTSPGRLLDISGRMVKELKPGPNDISRLAPGVYFYRAGASGREQTARLVMVR